MIKGGGRVELCWNDFPSKSNKKVRKHMEVVKLCWNEFLSKANETNVIKSGELGQIILETKVKKHWGVVKLCWN